MLREFGILKYLTIDIDSTLYVFNCVIDNTVEIFMLKDKDFDKNYEQYCNTFKVH